MHFHVVGSCLSTLPLQHKWESNTFTMLLSAFWEIWLQLPTLEREADGINTMGEEINVTHGFNTGLYTIYTVELHSLQNAE